MKKFLTEAKKHVPEVLAQKYPILILFISQLHDNLISYDFIRRHSLKVVILIFGILIYFFYVKQDIKGVLLRIDNPQTPVSSVLVACVSAGEDKLGDVDQTDDAGRFHFSRWLNVGGAYLLALEVDQKSDTALITETFVNSTDNKKDIKILFPARSIRVKTLDSIYFKNNNENLLLELSVYQSLEKSLSELKSNEDLDIILGGHTSKAGGESKNLDLSKLRLKKVADWLISQGIDGSRIICMNYGEKYPINASDIEDKPKTVAAEQNRIVTQLLIPRSREYHEFLAKYRPMPKNSEMLDQNSKSVISCAGPWKFSWLIENPSMILTKPVQGK